MNSNKIIIILLLFLCAIFAYQTFFQKTITNIEKAYAGGGSDNAEMLVVPFYVNSNEQKMAVFKKENVLYKGSKLSNQWCMTVYGMRDGRKLRLEASRWIENDFFLKDFNIAEKRNSVLHPESLRERKVKAEKSVKTKKPVKPVKPEKPKNVGIPIPDWFLNPPKEPGVAIYCTGTITMDSMDELGLARTAAAAIVRREIAESMKVKLQGVLSSYSKKIVAPSKKTMFVSLTQDVMRQIVDSTIHDAKIMHQAIEQYQDKYIIFVLVRISFDGIAKVMSDATRKEFEAVDENAAKAFDEMKKQVVAMTEKAFYTESAKQYLPE